MSYLHRLIDRATSNVHNLENNKIGKYSITPQHGTNVYVYYIYRDESNGKKHITTITIVPAVEVTIETYNCTARECTDIYNCIKEIYPHFKINFN